MTKKIVNTNPREIEWPQDTKVAYRDWQPSEPSPIVAYNMARRAAIEEKRGE